ncbi:carboxypeptidase M [Lampris incognitus]|uniref:carboxypeptidase M n=1 Tax=Lampris incognitus TaxID=2546036 RepID=UPI0024B6210E|nr:carboxypeptidase M [Lampris incognitus]
MGGVMLSLLLLLLTPGRGLEFRYHDTIEVEEYLLFINKTYPNITHLYSIGQSVQGRELWVLALGSSPRRHVLGIPEFKYIANMHGNEVVGRVMLLQLIDHLVQGYYSNEPLSSRLLNSTRIHILPSMNPDGFEASDTNCVYSLGRFNQNGVDLNRNFPDSFSGRRRQQQPIQEVRREVEVQAVMDWLKTETFVLSANLHGGALVASYPYDNSNGGRELVGGASVSPDNDVFVHLAKAYSYNHGSMHRGDSCHISKPFTDGITNGYQWYPLPGGMQDYNYIWAQCLELTLELSCCKYPPVNQLPSIWQQNRAALLAFIKQVHLGVKGRVFDSSGIPVQNAMVEVSGRRNLCPFRTNQHGEYYRLLLPGNHTFTVTFPGHQAVTETLNVPYGPDLYSAFTHNFLLPAQPTASPVHTSTPPCNHTPHWMPLDGGGPTKRPLWVGLSLVLGLGMWLTSLLY